MKQLNLKTIQKSYFIAEIGSNFNGSLNKAKDLISLAKSSGADAVKFQHYTADTLVSDHGFKNLENKSHQSLWSKSVFDTYRDAELNVIWTKELSEYCSKEKIDFITSPYSFELSDLTESYVSAFKIGSGDISWTELIKHIANKNKTIFLATGASNLEDVIRAMNVINQKDNLVLMQCNTNYEDSSENLKYQNISVLNKFKELFGNINLGLSDHTKSHIGVVCSIALGAKFFEKHFTDSNENEGPDHLFALNPEKFKEMISLAREAEEMLGSPNKKVEENEQEAFIVQRRSICLNKNLMSNHIIAEEDLCYLRPRLQDSFDPWQKDLVIGKKLKKDILKFQPLIKQDLI